MKRSIFCSGDEHKGTSKSFRCEHEVPVHSRVGLAELAQPVPIAELGPSLSDDTEIRGYNMPSIPHCTEGSPADDSLCSPAMPFSLCGTCQSPAPEPSQGPIRPSDSHPNQQIPQHRVNLQSSLVSARTRDPPAPKRKVSFAPGPGDSHPVSSQVRFK